MAVIIDSATKSPNKLSILGQSIDGFTGGDPQANVPPTQLTPKWCDTVQQEIGDTILRFGGGPLNGDLPAQMGEAVYNKLLHRYPHAPNTILLDEWHTQYHTTPAVDWKVHRLTDHKIAAAKNTVHNMCSFIPPDQSQVLVRWRASAVSTSLLSARAHYVWESCFRRDGNVFTETDTMIFEDNNIDALFTVTPTVSGTSLRLSINAPNSPNYTYNLFVSGEFQVLTMAT